MRSLTTFALEAFVAMLVVSIKLQRNAQASRGKVVFLMDQRFVSPVDITGHPSLKGRVLFTNSEPGHADAAFLERNDGSADIAKLVRKGYLIRTRTDADTKEARANDTAHRDAVMASGARILSTDYPASEPARSEGHFSVSFAEGTRAARCNPVDAPAACSDSLVKVETTGTNSAP